MSAAAPHDTSQSIKEVMMKVSMFQTFSEVASDWRMTAMRRGRVWHETQGKKGFCPRVGE